MQRRVRPAQPSMRGDSRLDGQGRSDSHSYGCSLPFQRTVESQEACDYLVHPHPHMNHIYAASASNTCVSAWALWRHPRLEQAERQISFATHTLAVWYMWCVRWSRNCKPQHPIILHIMCALTPSRIPIVWSRDGQYVTRGGRDVSHMFRAWACFAMFHEIQAGHYARFAHVSRMFRDVSRCFARFADDSRICDDSRCFAHVSQV